MSNKTRNREVSRLQNTLFSKLMLRDVYNKPVTVQGSVHWLFIALTLEHSRAINAPMHTSLYSNYYTDVHMLYSDDIMYHTYYYSTCFCLSVSRYVPYIGMVTILMNDYPALKVCT